MEIIPIELEPRHIENLKILEAGLRGLPEDYNHFGMGFFFREDYGDVPFGKNQFKKKIKHCGTAACGVGHAPLFGIKPSKPVDNPYDETLSWHEYSLDVFGLTGLRGKTEPAWVFLFGYGWTFSDDTPKGLANRIAFFLHHGGYPEFSSCQEMYAKDYSNLELETA